MPAASPLLQLGVPFAWFGMVVAISFLETPLKFRAPGITIPLGLGIGRLIFRALNSSKPNGIAGSINRRLSGTRGGELVIVPQTTPRGAPAPAPDKR